MHQNQSLISIPKPQGCNMVYHDFICPGSARWYYLTPSITSIQLKLFNASLSPSWMFSPQYLTASFIPFFNFSVFSIPPLLTHKSQALENADTQGSTSENIFLPLYFKNVILSAHPSFSSAKRLYQQYDRYRDVYSGVGNYTSEWCLLSFKVWWPWKAKVVVVREGVVAKERRNSGG